MQSIYHLSAVSSHISPQFKNWWTRGTKYVVRHLLCWLEAGLPRAPEALEFRSHVARYLITV